MKANIFNLILLFVLAAIPMDSWAKPVVLTFGNVTWQVHPATLSVSGKSKSNPAFQLSAPIFQELVSDLKQDNESASWALSNRNLQIHLQRIPNDGMQVSIQSTREQDLAWPQFPLTADDQMIWPLGEGLLFPVADAFWQKEIFHREWPAAESLSLPLAGISRNNAVATWISETPLRHTIEFTSATEPGNALAVMRVAQDFSRFSTAPRVMRFYLDETTNSLTPAQHFRDYLQETNTFKTLEEKAAETSSVALLKGAPFAYIWGNGIISKKDILPQQWQNFCNKLLADAESDKPLAAFLKSNFTTEQWQAVKAASNEKWVYTHLKRQIAKGLSNAIVSDNFPQAMTDTPDSANPGQTSIMQHCQVLARAFPDVFRPTDEWGGGVSNRMMNLLSDAGLEHLRLCTVGQEALQFRPDVARNATSRGWLIGTYDSYHSVHSPDMKPDNTWPTAQMTRELFENGAVAGKNGDPLTGFRGLGHKLNPVVGRDFMEQRVTRNLKAVPYNYYFIDCDATGEVFDDYSPAHKLAKESDIAERMRRLRWIGQQFNVVVGSEGGNAFAAASIAVAEGVYAPFFGWDDPAMKDRQSKFYRGAYYPPEEPAVFFKPIPLSAEHRKLYFDPLFKLPLYAAALHDCVEVSTHWNNGHFKYEELERPRELMDLLYLAPPLYHLNIDELQKRKAAILHFYETWSPLHQKFGFARLHNFQSLTPDRAVQKAVYVNSIGDECEITVNFSTRPFSLKNGDIIPPGAARIIAKSLWDKPQIYVPTK